MDGCDNEAFLQPIDFQRASAGEETEGQPVAVVRQVGGSRYVDAITCTPPVAA